MAENENTQRLDPDKKRPDKKSNVENWVERQKSLLNDAFLKTETDLDLRYGISADSSLSSDQKEMVRKLLAENVGPIMFSVRKRAQEDSSAEVKAFLEEIITKKDAFLNRWITKETQLENDRFFGDNVDQNKVAEYKDFFVRNRFPMREIDENGEEEKIEKYLSRVYTAALLRAEVYLWDKYEDQAETKPRTQDYREKPLYGPNSKAELLNAKLVYTNRDDVEVYSFGSFFDQFSQIFTNEEERKVVSEETDRWKKLFSEMTILHNRAVTRRIGNNPDGPGYDRSGPDGAIKGLENLQGELPMDLGNIFPNFKEREKLPTVEKEFLDATEFCMSVWSVLHLKEKERNILWEKIDVTIRDTFFDIVDVNVFDKSANRNVTRRVTRVKEIYSNILPIVNGVKEKQLKMVNDVINLAKKKMPSLENDSSQQERMARLAYHLGESYRIGGGLDTFFDLKYDDNKKLVNVQALDGESKLSSLGAYVESNNSKGVRTLFIDIIGKNLFQMYPPVVRMQQYTHDLNDTLTFVPDKRASLVHLLAAKGAISHVTDWKSSAVHDPDRRVYDIAREALVGFWNIATMEKALKNSGRLLWDPTKSIGRVLQNFANDPKVRMSLDSHYDHQVIARDNLRFVLGGSRQKKLIEIPKIAFNSERFSELNAIDKERVKNVILKDGVDYYLSAMKTDYPGDFVRLVDFLFTRDDNPDTHYFQNKRVDELFSPFYSKLSSMRSEVSVGAMPTLNSESEKLLTRLSAYYLLEVNMAICAWLSKPNFDKKYDDGRNIYPNFSDKDGWKKMISSLNNDTVAELGAQTNGGTLYGTYQIQAIINRMINLRDDNDFSRLMEKYFDAGYSLTPIDKAWADRTKKKLPFFRFGLLSFFQQNMNFALGKKYIETTSYDGKRKLYLLDDTEKSPSTPQDFIDKQILIQSLFKSE